MTEQQILKQITSVFAEVSLRHFPVDSAALLIHYGYTLYSYDELRRHSEELYQLCISCSNDAFQYIPKKIIAYNAQMPSSRIAFTLAHELGHYILQHDKQIATSRTDSPQAQNRLNNRLEWEANFFAGHLLAPRPAIHFAGCQCAEDVSAYFHLSRQAAGIAWEDYLKWKMRFSGNPQKMTLAEQDLLAYFYKASSSI